MGDKTYEEFKREVEEGSVSPGMEISPIREIDYEKLFEEASPEFEAGDFAGPDEDFYDESGFDEEGYRQVWESETEAGTTTESWATRLKRLKEQFQKGVKEGRIAKRRKEIEKYESEAQKLKEQISISTAKRDLRKLGGTKSQRFVQKVQDLKSIAGALDVKGNAGQGMRTGFQKMVPKAQMGSKIYSTGAGQLRELQTPRPDRSLYAADTEKLKYLSSPSRQTRLAETTTRLPRGMSTAPKMGKEMVTLDTRGLKALTALPKIGRNLPQVQKPKPKAQPPYYKKKVRDIRKGIV